MLYNTYLPNPDLASIVKFYWTLEVPYDPKNEKQKILPDGCIEMTFNFKDGIKRYTSENNYVVHPRAMIMGQRTRSYFIEPLGDVDSFAICFYPYGFANFINTPLKELTNIETPITQVFDESLAIKLEQDILNASNTEERISIIESFLLNKLNEEDRIEYIVKETVDILMASSGTVSINQIVKDDLSQRRKLERNFKKQIGISPKQLGKVIRLHTALNLLLQEDRNLSRIAYESEYFDQAHFIKDFKEFTGVTPKDFIGNKHMELATLFYKS